MLFLQLSAEPAVCESANRLPLEDTAALALERALLSEDRTSRLRELSEAAASSTNLANWAIRTAEMRLKRTINQVDEAVAWLSDHLLTELAYELTSDADPSNQYDVAWRLPRLVAALATAEKSVADFERRLEHEKLESLKELAYGASHEINNPLANIAARAQTLLEDETNSERQRKLVAIHRQAMRAHEMIADLMLFARPPKLNPTRFALNQLVDRVFGEFHELAAESGAELVFERGSDGVELVADSTQVGVALAAVVKNSLEAVDEGGHVHVATRRQANWAEIAVSDDGPGISAEIRQHIFDPFFSGREAGRGLGFGLSKCWRIVTDHGGEVIVVPRTAGAEIVIRLPIAADPEAIQ